MTSKSGPEAIGLSDKALLAEVSDYYTQKLSTHGETPKGVDWNGAEGQVLRFTQLCRLIQLQTFSIADLGCGYGAMFDYLRTSYDDFSYIGVDIADAMIDAAKKRYAHQDAARFITANRPDEVADYAVASGIFNVRLGRSDSEWKAYLVDTLDVLASSSRYGFAFNCLTSYSDAPFMRSDLYYADPCWLFDLCKRRYSKNVTLLHDYDLYEFTILVRKSS
ncbi:SAM-dependent methyltransferase [Pseudomonas sp. S25]|uniref:SAM-dependent methyltransferase n=2 Tax=Pseudomonas maioricensis TaxID=1766623 RepID=A0ABS9ZIJ7_9PSED|nr:SAM-dependent methyltransferase [Pseudomonas sp. S25]